jgi:hypothetical protein
MWMVKTDTKVRPAEVGPETVEAQGTSEAVGGRGDDEARCGTPGDDGGGGGAARGRDAVGGGRVESGVG